MVAWFNTLFFTYVYCCVSYLTLLMANIKNRKKLQLIQTIWDVMLYSQHFTFHRKLLGLVSRIEKSGTGDNNFGKWKGTFRSDRPKWPERSQWTTFKAGPEYSGRTKRKWSVPFDVPTEITGILGWMESAQNLSCFVLFLNLLWCEVKWKLFHDAKTMFKSPL